MQTLEFHLDHFDGPMDLLMHLLEKNKIDVYDIPINTLTEQYLLYLEDAKSMNLEIASHFLLLAAQLVRIKVKMLLPKRPSDEESEDPRQGLVDQIVAYRFFKELSSDLSALYEANSDYYTRNVDLQALSEKYKRIEPPRGLDARVLLTAFEVLERATEEKDQVMVIEKMSFSVEGLRQDLLQFCQEATCPTFQNVLRGCDSIDERITFFLALLECIRKNEIEVVQHELFGDIWLRAQAS